MPGEHIVFDGLWRCLCPSLDAATFTRALRTPSTIRRRFPDARPCQRLRQYSSHTLPTALLETSRANGRGRRRWGNFVRDSKEALDDDFSRYLFRFWKQRTWIPRSLFSRDVFHEESLDKVETRVLVDSLRELIHVEAQYHTICNLVNYLVTKRDLKPNAFLYQCLIRANVDPVRGSAQVVANLLQEMQSNGIAPTSPVYHDVLDVLAVHPDYVLRNQVIREMEHAWHAPNFSGQVSIVLGLLRDGQYEMALEKLEELNSTGVPFPPWLYDIFLFTFGELGIYTETLMILQRRLQDPDVSVSHHIWYFLLDVFGRGAFYEGIDYIWNRMVLSRRLVPSDGIALDILNTAARHGDATLAMQVMEMLLDRGKRLGMHHFEPLLDIHAANGDLRKAFVTLCLMVKAGLQPDLSSARPIFQRLQTSPVQTREAITILQDLRKERHVPIAAFNTVLQATLLHENFKTGLDLYRALRNFCSTEPDRETFSLLLDRCTLHKTMSFLLAEMEVFRIRPDEVMYNRIILISTLNTNYEPAFRYLEKMRSGETNGRADDWWLYRGTALGLVRRCIMAEDARVQGLLQECKERGMEGIEEEVQILLEKQRRQREKALAAKHSTEDSQPPALPEPPAFAAPEPALQAVG